jgi:hypothetical protein
MVSCINEGMQSVRLLVILADVLGILLKIVVCHCLLLGLNIGPFSFLHFFAGFIINKSAKFPIILEDNRHRAKWPFNNLNNQCLFGDMFN